MLTYQWLRKTRNTGGGKERINRDIMKRNTGSDSRKICIFGGASLYRLPLYNMMADTLDCDFYITRFGDGRDKTIKAYDYADLKSFREEVVLKPIGGNFNWNTSIWRLFRMSYKYYVVAGAWDLSSWFLILLCSLTRKRVISWSHGIYGREVGLRLWIKKTFFKLCHKCLVYNERSRELMIAQGVCPDDVVSVHNSLDYAAQLPLRGRNSEIFHKHFGNSLPVLFFIGRLIEGKQLDMLIDVTDILRRRDIEVNTVIIGDGPAKTALQDKTEMLKLKDNVWFYGPCYNEEEKSELIASADICITPGAIGLTCIDSMMFGTPVITKDDLNNQGPEYAAIHEGRTGSFFKANDLNDLADAIEAWLNDHQDREQTRFNCYQEIDNYWTPEYEVEQIKKVF